MASRIACCMALVCSALWLHGCGESHESVERAMPAASAAPEALDPAADNGESPRETRRDVEGADGAPEQDAPPGAPSDAQPAAPSAAAGSEMVAPPPSNATSAVNGEALEIEQRLTDVRPEFVDYFWNNLDAAHFEQWFPEEHDAFAWKSAPKKTGDLGAEVGASFQATEIIAGTRHEIVVTYIDRATAADHVTLDYAMVADVMIDGQGPYRWIVQYTTDGDWNLLMKQRLELPHSGGAEAWSKHLELRMANLAGFLKGWFQKDFVEAELMSRGQSTISSIGDAITGDFEIVIEQHIDKLNHDMVDWWWDNIKDTMRYHRWHPIAHEQFTWLTPPKNTTDLAYDVGAVQQIVEIIGESNTLDISWLSPANLPVELTYDHFVYGSTMLSGTPFGGFLLHEYANDPERGGINMKSTFRLPALAGMPFAEALAAHCIQEMQFLQYFLPAVFVEEYRP